MLFGMNTPLNYCQSLLSTSGYCWVSADLQDEADGYINGRLYGHFVYVTKGNSAVSAIVLVG